MQQPSSDHVTIGILGTHLTLNPRSIRGRSGLTPPSGPTALQGAFAEHQVMLQKLSLKRRVVIVLVRQQEDLDKCDALIIPGGGEAQPPS